MGNAANWILSRMKEPSSYAAAGGAVVGLGVLVDKPIVIFIGSGGCALGFICKEKGVI